MILLTMLIVLASSAAALFETWWPTIVLLLPIVQAVGVRYNAEKEVKVIASLALAVVFAGVSLVTEPITDLSPEILMTRAVTLWFFGQLVYRTVNQAFKRSTGMELNEQQFARPMRGIG